MFGNILDFVASIYTVIRCRLHRIFCGLGSVYSSQAFQRAHEHYNILRSMAKWGTPTYNAIIEALNGWIKEELYLDFGLETAEDVPKLLDEYVYYFNNRRPAAALGYKSPVQYKTELGF